MSLAEGSQNLKERIFSLTVIVADMSIDNTKQCYGSESLGKVCITGHCKKTWKVFAVIITMIVLYFIALRLFFTESEVPHNDFMNRKIIDIPQLENCCSWWAVSHFVLFFFLGLVFPQCDVLVISAGILWELVEMGMAKIFNRKRQAIRLTNDSIEYSQNWWAGSTKDIFVNILGFYCGKLMNKGLGLTF